MLDRMMRIVFCVVNIMSVSFDCLQGSLIFNSGAKTCQRPRPGRAARAANNGRFCGQALIQSPNTKKWRTLIENVLHKIGLK